VADFLRLKMINEPYSDNVSDENLPASYFFPRYNCRYFTISFSHCKKTVLVPSLRCFVFVV